MSLTTTLEQQQSHGPQREPVALVDLLDRLIGAGVVLSGDIKISIAGVDLVQIRLNALITSVRAEMAEQTTDREPGGSDV